MRLRLVLLGISTVVAIGCASAMVQPSAQPLADRELKVDKWFAVIVDPGPNKTCVVTIYPDNKDEGNVTLKPGWRVGWTLINRCDSTQALSVEGFTHVAHGAKNPINFQPFADQAIVGKVKKRFWGGCQKDTEEAPCGVYKYTVKVGQWIKDPDVEIVH